MAGSERSIGARDLIQCPGRASGILVLQVRNLIWTHDKFHAFKLDGRRPDLGLSGGLARTLNAFLDFALCAGMGWLQG